MSSPMQIHKEKSENRVDETRGSPKRSRKGKKKERKAGRGVNEGKRHCLESPFLLLPCCSRLQPCDRGKLVPGVLAPCVLDHLIITHSHDLLHALRATRFHKTDKVGLIKKLIGDNIQPMIQDIPGMQAPEQITSLVSALQWWAAQPPGTVTTPPTQTVILIHLPSASTPTLLHIGSKQPTTAIYLQQFTQHHTASRQPPGCSPGLTWP